MARKKENKNHLILYSKRNQKYTNSTLLMLVYFFFLRDVLLSKKKIRPEFHYSNFEFKWGNQETGTYPSFFC